MRRPPRSELPPLSKKSASTLCIPHTHPTNRPLIHPRHAMNNSFLSTDFLQAPVHLEVIRQSYLLGADDAGPDAVDSPLSRRPRAAAAASGTLAGAATTAALGPEGGQLAVVIGEGVKANHLCMPSRDNQVRNLCIFSERSVHAR